MSKKNHRLVLAPLVKAINELTEEKWEYLSPAATKNHYTIKRAGVVIGEGMRFDMAEGYLMATMHNLRIQGGECLSKAEAEELRREIDGLQNVLKAHAEEKARVRTVPAALTINNVLFNFRAHVPLIVDICKIAVSAESRGLVSFKMAETLVFINAIKTIQVADAAAIFIKDPHKVQMLILLSSEGKV